MNIIRQTVLKSVFLILCVFINAGICRLAVSAEPADSEQETPDQPEPAAETKTEPEETMDEPPMTEPPSADDQTGDETKQEEHDAEQPAEDERASERRAAPVTLEPQSADHRLTVRSHWVDENGRDLSQEEAGALAASAELLRYEAFPLGIPVHTGIRGADQILSDTAPVRSVMTDGEDVLISGSGLSESSLTVEDENGTVTGSWTENGWLIENNDLNGVASLSIYVEEGIAPLSLSLGECEEELMFSSTFEAEDRKTCKGQDCIVTFDHLPSGSEDAGMYTAYLYAARPSSSDPDIRLMRAGTPYDPYDSAQALLDDGGTEIVMTYIRKTPHAEVKLPDTGGNAELLILSGIMLVCLGAEGKRMRRQK